MTSTWRSRHEDHRRLKSVGGLVTPAEMLARRFHEIYERLAPAFGYTTRPETAVAWEQMPERNRELMIAVCAELIDELCVDTLAADFHDRGTP